MSENEYEAYPIANTSAVEAISRADFDVQISTAKRYPMHSDQRGLERFRNDAITMATLDQDTAESCLFALPRGGKTIEGKSVRLAEIVVAAYGNIKAGARIIETNDNEVVAQGVCHDLERNVSQSAEVRRRITDKNGKRYNEDLIILTCNAACSIAFRNAVFKVIPGALCEPVYKAAKLMATGNKQTLDIRRAKAIQQFALMGVTQDQILTRLNKSAISFIDGDDLALLIGLYKAIKDGEASVDETFPQVEEDEKPITRTDAVAEKIGARKARQKPKPDQMPAEVVETSATVKDGPKDYAFITFSVEPDEMLAANLTAAGYMPDKDRLGWECRKLNAESRGLAEVLADDPSVEGVRWA